MSLNYRESKSLSLYSPTNKLKIRLQNSPKINSWKMAYQNTKKQKLLNILDNIIHEKQQEKDQLKKQIKFNEFDRLGKSSYQMYKEKQKLQKEKLLQAHTIQNPKSNCDQFYCKLRIKQSRNQRRHIKQRGTTLNFGTLNTIKSEIHQRDDQKRDLKSSRQCFTQITNRKYPFSYRKYSLDNPITITNRFLIRRNSNTNYSTFQATCRPWSPGNFHEVMPLQSEESFTIF